MKNNIWDTVYNVWLMTYKSTGWNIRGREITIRKYKIIKETPKFYILSINIYRTFNYSEIHKVTNYIHEKERYRKEKVGIWIVETKDDLIKKLNKTIKQVHEDDNLSVNAKKEYQKSYDVYIKYFKDEK